MPPFSPSIHDRERDKFVEHPNGETSVRVKISNPGDISGGGGGSSAATTPTIYNLSMPNSGTEYAQALGANTKQFLVRMRNRARAKLSFTLNGTDTLFFTLEPGAVYFEKNLNLSSVTLYVQSEASGQVAEVLEWS